MPDTYDITSAVTLREIRLLQQRAEKINRKLQAEEEVLRLKLERVKEQHADKITKLQSGLDEIKQNVEDYLEALLATERVVRKKDPERNLVPDELRPIKFEVSPKRIVVTTGNRRGPRVAHLNYDDIRQRINDGQIQELTLAQAIYYVLCSTHSCYSIAELQGVLRRLGKDVARATLHTAARGLKDREKLVLVCDAPSRYMSDVSYEAVMAQKVEGP